jgi:hypothetical protein
MFIRIVPTGLKGKAERASPLLSDFKLQVERRTVEEHKIEPAQPFPSPQVSPQVGEDEARLLRALADALDDAVSTGAPTMPVLEGIRELIVIHVGAGIEAMGVLFASEKSRGGDTGG